MEEKCINGGDESKKNILRLNWEQWKKNKKVNENDAILEE